MYAHSNLGPEHVFPHRLTHQVSEVINLSVTQANNPKADDPKADDPKAEVPKVNLGNMPKTMENAKKWIGKFRGVKKVLIIYYLCDDLR